MSQIFSVDELALAAGTSARAIRLYMKKGLLNPQRAGKVYVFTTADLETLNHIQRTQRLGLSLKEIKDLTTEPTLHLLKEWREQLKSLTADAKTELEAVEHNLRELKNKGANS